MIPVRIGASYAKRTVAISIEVAALDSLVIRVGNSIIPFIESFPWNGIPLLSQFMLTMGEGAFEPKIARACSIIQLAH
jgi:hypothetical protein